MVNSRSGSSERRAGARADVVQPGLLGQAKLNPFGDLHTLQHLSARLARGFKAMWEPLLRREVRCWAEPLAVQRFVDYRAERPDRLTAWLPLDMSAPPAGARSTALIVLDGGFVLSLLDLFFGGAGVAPTVLPTEFSPAADAMLTGLAAQFTAPLTAAWEPLAAQAFQARRPETNAALLAGIDGDDAVVITRFGLAGGSDAPVFIDILYPVGALKPFAATLNGKVLDKAEPDPAWRAALTRSVMAVKFPVRSVLAEPVVRLSMLMSLKPGDVIPISVAADVPVMIGRDRLGAGTVGAANGRAAIRLTSLSHIEGLHP